MKFQGKKGLLWAVEKTRKGSERTTEPDTGDIQETPTPLPQSTAETECEWGQAEWASGCWDQHWRRDWTWNFQFKPELLEWSQSDPNSMTTRVRRKWLIYRFPSISGNSIILHNNEMFKDLKDGRPRSNMIEVITKRE